MVRKILLGLLVLFILIIGAAALFFGRQYVRYKNNPDPHKTFLEPRVERVTTDISELNEKEIRMMVNVLLKNPMPLRFKADSLRYEIFMDDKEVSHSIRPAPIDIKADDSSWISVPVLIDNERLKGLFDELERKGEDSVDYKVKLSFYARIFFKRKFHLTIQRKIHRIYIPGIKTESVDVDSVSLKGALIKIHIKVDNRNVFPLKARNVNYEFEIENHGAIKGFIEGITEVPAQSDKEIVVPVRISFKEAKKSLVETLQKGNKANYTLKLVFYTEAGLNSLDSSKVVLNMHGALKSLVKLAKR